MLFFYIQYMWYADICVGVWRPEAYVRCLPSSIALHLPLFFLPFSFFLSFSYIHTYLFVTRFFTEPRAHQYRETGWPGLSVHWGPPDCTQEAVYWLNMSPDPACCWCTLYIGTVIPDGDGRSHKAGTALWLRSSKAEPHDGCHGTFAFLLHLLRTWESFNICTIWKCWIDERMFVNHLCLL